MTNARLVARDETEEKVQSLVRRAGEAILSVYSKTEYWSAVKSDQSPVTEADMISHTLLVEGLPRILDVPVLSEEAPVAYETRSRWSRFWLVDPLDGTKDFIARNGEFTVNVALVVNNVHVLGVVGIPVWNTLYSATSGKGAVKLEGDSVPRTLQHAGRSEGYICAESRFHPSPETAAFCAQYGITSLKTVGSSIKLCFIAEGEIDVYPRFQPTKEWDTAAGHCILNESGGKLVVMSSLEPLRYNKPDIVNPSFIACSKTFPLRH